MGGGGGGEAPMGGGGAGGGDKEAVASLIIHERASDKLSSMLQYMHESNIRKQAFHGLIHAFTAMRKINYSDRVIL